MRTAGHYLSAVARSKEMKRCRNCKWLPKRYLRLSSVCPTWTAFRDKPAPFCAVYERKPWMGWLWLIALIIIITLALILAGCSPGQHHGHIYIHDPNHIEVIFDRPMSMSVDRDGVKVEASSMQPGFFEDIIKFLLLRPR